MNKPDVKVPPSTYRMSSVETHVWDLIGVVLEFRTALLEEDRQKVFSAALSRVSREMRRDYGPDKTAEILRRFAETQHEAEQYDDTDERNKCHD